MLKKIWPKHVVKKQQKGARDTTTTKEEHSDECKQWSGKTERVETG